MVVRCSVYLQESCTAVLVSVFRWIITKPVMYHILVRCCFP